MQQATASSWKSRLKTVIFAVLVLGAVGAFLTSTWAVLEVLRWLSGLMFIHVPAGRYIRLDSNSIVNVWPNNVLVLFYVLAVPSLLADALEQYRKRRKGKRRTEAGAGTGEGWRLLCLRLSAVTLAVFVLGLLGMNTYTIVTPTAIVQRTFFSLHADTYPISALSAIACTVAGRGAIVTDFSLIDGRQLSLGGLDTRVATAIAKVRGIPIDYDSRCFGRRRSIV
ncbi:hypothetical protein C8K18_1335 [Paraburkholderia sp. GV068]|uniref:hypothetical protein n=1 Tax=Paraburkholderia TaxID=1822464 RepID=UPI000D4CD9CD|nr:MULTISPECIES: hypothetical protein [unclassified Paraburkholderia]PTQ90563.1 hypothetical protein C8K19_1335 [Paraburkholderia sp. GV072]PUA93586.1 hypothetical protein C8K18_1335 [Paraburkholderia sp. GV068]